MKILLLIIAITLTGNQKEWVVPFSATIVKNKTTADVSSMAEGKRLYQTHCRSCHGTTGLGNGSKAGQLKTEPGNFSTIKFQSQTDGSLFFKTTEGRSDMPSFKKKLPDADDRWYIVNYMRTFKK